MIKYLLLLSLFISCRDPNKTPPDMSDWADEYCMNGIVYYKVDRGIAPKVVSKMGTFTYETCGE